MQAAGQTRAAAYNALDLNQFPMALRPGTSFGPQSPHRRRGHGRSLQSPRYRRYHWWLSLNLLGVLVLLATGCGEQPAAVAHTEVPAAESTLYFPPADGGWEHVEPDTVGWNRKALDRALVYAREQRTSGLVVLHAGRILVEAHWEVPPLEGSRYSDLGSSPASRAQAIEDVASVQKSVVSFLIGVALTKGLLALDDPVAKYLGDEWSNATLEQEAVITLRHLMSMTSGLATELTFETPAGDKWMYNTSAYSRLLPVLEAATGLTVAEYTAQWLTEQVGMSDSVWGDRPWVQPGADANRVGFRTTARDLARFGLLVLSNGTWDGIGVLTNSGYLRESLRPSQDLNPSYGLLWWLNGQPRSLGEWVSTGTPRSTAAPPVLGPLVPPAPEDLVAAQGALGRKLYIVPSLDLVVSRLGDRPEAGFNTELWQRLMAAAPSS